MVQLRHSLTVAALLAGPAVYGANIQKSGLQLPSSAGANRDAVQKIFTDSYSAYKKYAFGHDDVSPVSKGFSDPRNGWGASIIDAMSTMSIMGLTDLYNEAVQFAGKIDFSKSHSSDSTTSVFETTIRYLGGFLSAYELNGKKDAILVQKAKEVADKMAYAFQGDIPHGYIDFSTNTVQNRGSNIAEAGTLALEWRTLSKYTGNATYGDLAEKALRHIANLATPLPGLAPQGIDPVSGKFSNSYLSWGGGSDSYFEYLIKYPRLTNTNDQLFAKTWATAVDSTIKNMLKTGSVGGWKYVGDWNNGLVPVSSHLECFHGGNWLMGGRLLNNQTIVDHALELVDSCWNTYAGTATGIGPEAFRWFPQGATVTITGSTLDFYNKHGYYISSSPYILRPEVLESNFYAWRVTGDTKYLDRAAAAVKSFNTYLRSSSFEGYAALNNVNSVNGGFIDDTESFWFAEVLKYLYLTFDDPAHISLDQWVFNTEAHPFQAPAALTSYSDGKPLPPKRETFSPVTGTASLAPPALVSGLTQPTQGAAL